MDPPQREACSEAMLWIHTGSEFRVGLLGFEPATTWLVRPTRPTHGPDLVTIEEAVAFRMRGPKPHEK